MAMGTGLPMTIRGHHQPNKIMCGALQNLKATLAVTWTGLPLRPTLLTDFFSVLTPCFFEFEFA